MSGPQVLPRGPTPDRCCAARLRHDLVMIGRTAINPLPDPISTRLEPSLARVGVAFATYLRAMGAALQLGRPPPPLTDMESALDAYAAEVAAVRREGLTRNLPSDSAERFFALGFALEQMRDNFKDLQRWVAESAVLSTVHQGAKS